MSRYSFWTHRQRNPSAAIGNLNQCRGEDASVRIATSLKARLCLIIKTKFTELCPRARITQHANCEEEESELLIVLVFTMGSRCSNPDYFESGLLLALGDRPDSFPGGG